MIKHIKQENIKINSVIPSYEKIMNRKHCGVEKKIAPWPHKGKHIRIYAKVNTTATKYSTFYSTKLM